jgi:hypothetical protein
VDFRPLIPDVDFATLQQRSRFEKTNQTAGIILEIIQEAQFYSTENDFFGKVNVAVVNPSTKFMSEELENWRFETTMSFRCNDYPEKEWRAECQFRNLRERIHGYSATNRAWTSQPLDIKLSLQRAWQHFMKLPKPT